MLWSEILCWTFSGETIAKLPSTPISKTAPANVTAADKGKLSLWELAELGLQKEIAW